MVTIWPLYLYGWIELQFFFLFFFFEREKRDLQNVLSFKYIRSIFFSVSLSASDDDDDVRICVCMCIQCTFYMQAYVPM